MRNRIDVSTNLMKTIDLIKVIMRHRHDKMFTHSAIVQEGIELYMEKHGIQLNVSEQDMKSFESTRNGYIEFKRKEKASKINC